LRGVRRQKGFPGVVGVTNLIRLAGKQLTNPHP
jgi:hypothetical protein